MRVCVRCKQKRCLSSTFSWRNRQKEPKKISMRNEERKVRACEWVSEGNSYFFHTSFSSSTSSSSLWLVSDDVFRCLSMLCINCLASFFRDLDCRRGLVWGTCDISYFTPFDMIHTNLCRWSKAWLSFRFECAFHTHPMTWYGAIFHGTFTGSCSLESWSLVSLTSQGLRDRVDFLRSAGIAFRFCVKNYEGQQT